MIYEQYLSEKGQKGYKLKKTFLIVGLVDILLGLTLAIIFACIYWKLSLPFLVLIIIGLIFGSIAYTFCKSYKYTFENGLFTVYRLNCYGGYKVVFSENKEDIEMSDGKGKSLTNLDRSIVITTNGVKYEISPDDYMTALIFGE